MASLPDAACQPQLDLPRRPPRRPGDLAGRAGPAAADRRPPAVAGLKPPPRAPGLRRTGLPADGPGRPLVRDAPAAGVRRRPPGLLAVQPGRLVAGAGGGVPRPPRGGAGPPAVSAGPARGRPATDSPGGVRPQPAGQVPHAPAVGLHQFPERPRLLDRLRAAPRHVLGRLLFGDFRAAQPVVAAPPVGKKGRSISGGPAARAARRRRSPPIGIRAPAGPDRRHPPELPVRPPAPRSQWYRRGDAAGDGRGAASPPATPCFARRSTPAGARRSPPTRSSRTPPRSCSPGRPPRPLGRQPGVDLPRQFPRGLGRLAVRLVGFHRPAAGERDLERARLGHGGVQHQLP